MADTLHFAAIADKNFLLRIVALCGSLERQKTPWHLWLLCIDTELRLQMERLQIAHVTLIDFSEVEKGYPALKAIEPTRSRYEYLMTAKPFLLRYLLEHKKEGDVLCYCDGDIAFFGDASEIRTELRNHSILLTPHREPLSAKNRGMHGLYNAGFIAVRRTAQAVTMVQWWCERVVEWCEDRVDNDRFIDQKYLDRVPSLFPDTRISDHPGLNVAPWNLATHRFTRMQGHLFVDDRPLVFYHFHGLKRVSSWLIDTGIAPYRTACSAVVRRFVYGPYLQSLKNIRARLQKEGMTTDLATVRSGAATKKTLGLLFSRLRRGQWLLG